MLNIFPKALFAVALLMAANVSSLSAQDSTGIDSAAAQKSKYEQLVWNLDTTNTKKYYPNEFSTLSTRGEYCFVLDATASIDSMRPDLIFEWELDGARKVRGTKTRACFPDPGAHVIWLNVLDTISGTADMQVHWLDPFSEPDLAFSHGGNYLMGSTIRFDGTKYLDAGQFQSGGWLKGVQSDVNRMEQMEKNEDLERFRASVLVWDFGNGVVRVGSKSNHVWHEPGNYKVILSVVRESNVGLEVVKSCYETLAIYPNR